MNGLSITVDDSGLLGNHRNDNRPSGTRPITPVLAPSNAPRVTAYDYDIDFYPRIRWVSPGEVTDDMLDRLGTEITVILGQPELGDEEAKEPRFPSLELAFRRAGVEKEHAMDPTIPHLVIVGNGRVLFVRSTTYKGIGADGTDNNFARIRRPCEYRARHALSGPLFNQHAYSQPLLDLLALQGRFAHVNSTALSATGKGTFAFSTSALLLYYETGGRTVIQCTHLRSVAFADPVFLLEQTIQRHSQWLRHQQPSPLSDAEMIRSTSLAKKRRGASVLLALAEVALRYPARGYGGLIGTRVLSETSSLMAHLASTAAAAHLVEKIRPMGDWHINLFTKLFKDDDARIFTATQSREYEHMLREGDVIVVRVPKTLPTAASERVVEWTETRATVIGYDEDIFTARFFQSMPLAHFLWFKNDKKYQGGGREVRVVPTIDADRLNPTFRRLLTRNAIELLPLEAMHSRGPLAAMLSLFTKGTPTGYCQSAARTRWLVQCELDAMANSGIYAAVLQYCQKFVGGVNPNEGLEKLGASLIGNPGDILPCSFGGSQERVIALDVVAWFIKPLKEGKRPVALVVADSHLAASELAYAFACQEGVGGLRVEAIQVVSKSRYMHTKQRDPQLTDGWFMANEARAWLEKSQQADLESDGPPTARVVIATVDTGCHPSGAGATLVDRSLEKGFMQATADDRPFLMVVSNALQVAIMRFWVAYLQLCPTKTLLYANYSSDDPLYAPDVTPFAASHYPELRAGLLGRFCWPRDDDVDTWEEPAGSLPADGVAFPFGARSE